VLAGASLLFPAVAGAQSLFDDSASRSSFQQMSARSSLDITDDPFDQRMSTSVERPLLFDDTPAPAPSEQPNIHGFFSSPFRTAYVTPRGLVVENEGLVWQPVGGLVFPIGDIGPIKNFTFVGGIWNSVNTHQDDPYVGPWNEMDVFASISGTIAGSVSLTLTYSPWNSPPHAFHTEHNMDLKIQYDDSKLWGQSGFSLNPYVDCWWAMAGDSTVILGRKGGTGYFEPGIAPTYTIKAIPDYPISLSLPMYVQLGPSTYWDATGAYGHKEIGLASISANISVPLSFIPARYGHWHADAGVTYDYLINNALLNAGTIASGNTDRSVVIGSIGIGVNF